MAKKINHQEALQILGLKHESEIQQKLYSDYHHVINASDVINVVRYLTEMGYIIKKS